MLAHRQPLLKPNPEEAERSPLLRFLWKAVSFSMIGKIDIARGPKIQCSEKQIASTGTQKCSVLFFSRGHHDRFLLRGSRKLIDTLASSVFIFAIGKIHR